MKQKHILILALALALPAGAAYGQLPVIPAPVQVETAATGRGNTRVELGRSVGRKAFARRTAFLSPEAREEAYLLTVSPKGYRIEANTETGCARALQTLRQIPDGTWSGTVFDYPRFPYRGFMLDISRHFRDKDFILKQLDALASVKLNVLHLHLTDDAGWRLQIDRYPALTRQAAWRIGRTWAEWRDGGQRYATAETGDGGFLTRSDIREILDRAAELHITVIPEIEMPGHSREVIKAYPELGCFPGSDEFCPGKEATFRFLENVLDEVTDLFPSTYIHIGGDEASKRDWSRCPDCRARMEAEGLQSVEQLQSYLVRRIEAWLHGKGRRLIGWDEILEGGLSPDATVMSWRGTEGGVEAMRQGHDAIMTPGRYCYINNAQDAPLFEERAEGGYLPLDVVYGYEPLQGIPEELHPHLKGLQANLWQEHVTTPERTEYMMYPRVAAIAETGWSRPEAKTGFRERVQRWTDALADGSLTGRSFTVFDLRNERGERAASRTPVRHLARGCPVSYSLPYSSSYTAGGDGALTDGRCGGWSFGDGRWQGFLSDVEVTVDLGQEQTVHYAGATFLCQTGPDIWLPDRVEIWTSADGAGFVRAAVIDNEAGPVAQSYTQFGAPVSGRARYVRLKAFRAAHGGWLFLDEVVVN